MSPEKLFFAIVAFQIIASIFSAIKKKSAKQKQAQTQTSETQTSGDLETKNDKWAKGKEIFDTLAKELGMPVEPPTPNPPPVYTPDSLELPQSATPKPTSTEPAPSYRSQSFPKLRVTKTVPEELSYAQLDLESSIQNYFNQDLKPNIQTKEILNKNPQTKREKEAKKSFSLLSELRLENASNLKKAVILKEILDKPISLRRVS